MQRYSVTASQSVKKINDSANQLQILIRCLMGI